MKRGELVFTKTFKAEFSGAERHGNATFKAPAGNLMIFVHMGVCPAGKMNEIDAGKMLNEMGWTFQAETPSPPPATPQQEQHSDDLAVDRFAAAMKARMAEMRARGKHGWEDCTIERLDSLLRATTDYTQPVDTGNYAMMMYNRSRP